MRSRTFIRRNNGKEFLALAITGQQFGSRPSELLGIKDEVIALGLDIAGAIRLDRHDGLLRECESELLAVYVGSVIHTGKLPRLKEASVEYI